MKPGSCNNCLKDSLDLMDGLLRTGSKTESNYLGVSTLMVLKNQDCNSTRGKRQLARPTKIGSEGTIDVSKE